MTNKRKKIAIIGGGISGLSAANYAAKNGHEVHLFEKNDSLGGRARQFKTENGYTFDMGPSWYWMPDIIENFFQDFNTTTSAHYELINLDPQFEIVFKKDNVEVPSNYDDLKILFESIEKGAANKLDEFMQDAKIKYEVGMHQFVEKPCHSWFEFFSITIAKSALKLDILTNYRSFVAKYFSHSYLKAIMEFPVIFLGASPKNIPAMYSLMNYGGYQLGTWYPMGGFYELILAMQRIAEHQGVKIHLNSAVNKIHHQDNKVNALEINDTLIEFDEIIASADYHHAETLLDADKRNYSSDYWGKKTFAPSCLIFYLGINTKLPNLAHHTLFFENELDQHIDEIYETKQWPTAPLFYVCCPSKTDPNVAPKDCENIFLLMPIGIGMQDDDSIREKYLVEMLHRLELKTGIKNLAEKIEYKRSYCVNDFVQDYNAYGGNAYGLANTLGQTAVLKPSIRNKKIKNLIYTGQLTVPGPGVPPSLISGKIAANQINH